MTSKSHGADHPARADDSVGWTEAHTVRFGSTQEPIALQAGGKLGPVVVEYETYGKLNKTKSNAILITHALSGDAHAAGWDKTAEKLGRSWRTNKPGWWDTVIGPGKPLDTKKYFLICSNFIGSCYGSSGPSSPDQMTGRPYGLRFPIVTVCDWVRIQAMLLDELGIDKLHSVIGGSLGGQQAIEWGLRYPERVENVLVLAASPRLSAQGLGFNAVGRYCIMNDPDFANGDYYGSKPPGRGLAAARMLAHITYLSEEGMHKKFGRRLRQKTKPDFSFGVEFEVESYLNHQGLSFVERFDANSYLYITRAMDYYDAAAEWGGGNLVEACRRIKSRVMVMSFSSDWLYPPEHCKEFALALSRNGKTTTYVSIPSPYGHDAFLVETEQVGRYLLNFLEPNKK